MTTAAPPLNRDRERFLLGCAIFGREPERAVRALADVPPAAFRDPECRMILQAMQALHRRGEVVGLPEVFAELNGAMASDRLMSLADAIDSEALFDSRLRVSREAAGLQEEEKALRIPETAWFGLLRTWREVIAPYTEAPLESLWAAFVLVAGLLCGRNIRVENPRPLYPNFFMMLVGATGDLKKSTTLWLCESLLRSLGEEVEIIRGIVSTEGIYERLKVERHPEGARALGYVDELRALLSVGRRRATQDILPKLNSMYYCPEEDAIDRREKSTTIRRPFFSLIAATSLDYVRDLLGTHEIVGGTLNRFLVISGPEQPPKPRVRKPSPAELQGVVGPLRAMRQRLEARPVEIAWGEREAAALWDQFYLAWKEARRGRPRLDADLTARTPEHVLKVALLFTALTGEVDFSPEVMARAIAVGEWIERTAIRLFRNLGQDPMSQAQELIVSVVKRAGGEMRTRDVQQRLSKEVPAGTFRAALRGLLEADVLCEGRDCLESGQSAKVLRMPGNT